jgi:hypothetical protein
MGTLADVVRAYEYIAEAINFRITTNCFNLREDLAHLSRTPYHPQNQDSGTEGIRRLYQGLDRLRQAVRGINAATVTHEASDQGVSNQ